MSCDLLTILSVKAVFEENSCDFDSERVSCDWTESLKSLKQGWRGAGDTGIVVGEPATQFLASLSGSMPCESGSLLV